MMHNMVPNPTPHQPISNPSIRQYPQIDSMALMQSAKSYKNLLQEANLLIDKLSSSTDFNNKLMYAAQHSNIKEVERLITSIGITSNLKVSYNPDGLHLEIYSKIEHVTCCKLIMAIRWR
ncbi:hypothetical protein [Bacillus taeanensis]|uniref:Inner spore coat protein n=1 Tax=Bacillus taeanensis TaxID=273032 RepID=A0A366XSU0_9BACI|nr:hypothetical protein [Bacillus taeanensis]RBW68957.1 hypothetical protein DS031_13530 [Bacillus taeanensis]